MVSLTNPVGDRVLTPAGTGRSTTCRLLFVLVILAHDALSTFNQVLNEEVGYLSLLPSSTHPYHHAHKLIRTV